MKKDVIYIDTEDDITSIIDKVKASKEKIIALVPPKRVGVLQSAVNLKLLQKSANSSDKRIVLITTNKALSALAAGVTMPVAKNLQSKPEVAEVAAPVEEDEADDIINGDDMPVGELEKTADPAIADPEDDIEMPEDIPAAAKPKGPKKSKSKKTGPNIPNFDIFRKKLFLAIAAGVLFIIFLIWAIWFAPHATVNIKAKTTTEDVNAPIGLNVNGTTDIDEKILQPTVQQVKKTFSTDFNATGKKDIGTKATGTITLYNRETTESTVTVPAGTAVSTNGLNFITASTAVIPRARFVGSLNPGTVNVAVSAQNVGDEYNISSGESFTVAGQSSLISGRNSSSFSGGSKKTVTVVSDSDINSARAKIIEQNGEAGRKELEDKFDDKKYVIIEKSYKSDPTTTTSSPASGNEASNAKLTVEITYTLTALKKDDVNKILNSILKEEIETEKNQKVFDNGITKLEFVDFNDNGVTLKTVGYIGPNVDEKVIKPQLVGKNYEEIRERIKSIEGVQEVETNFFPFWVSTAPGVDKIEIKFVVDKDD